MADLISPSTRGMFRSLMTDSTVDHIGAAFQDEGFAPNPDSTYEDSSVRRETTQAYLDAVNWSDPAHVRRFLNVADRLLDGWSGDNTDALWRRVMRDGYERDQRTGAIVAVGGNRAIESLRHVSDASAIRELLDRMSRAADDDPPLAVGSAKEIVESTAKVVLAERGLAWRESADLPELVRAAEIALGLHPSTATAGPDASDGVRKILGAVTTITTGLAELRNRGHGTGHGPVTARVGLRPRHAHLAVNAAITCCQLMIDTLADPEAPWRDLPAESAGNQSSVTGSAHSQTSS
jgi:hypothetical protein